LEGKNDFESELYYDFESELEVLLLQGKLLINQKKINQLENNQMKVVKLKQKFMEK
jgi:hypothetical protein